MYLASSEKLGTDVALKVTKSESDEQEDPQVFAREYEALSALKNPAIVTIYDYGINAGREYLAMEYFPRGGLQEPTLARHSRGRCAALPGTDRPRPAGGP
ncbi:MAG: protein kinase [Steroidobacteraceae bacterium]